MLSKAIVSIGIDENNQISYSFEGDKRLVLNMIGAVDVSKNWLKGMYAENMNMQGEDKLLDREEKPTYNNNEIEVTKDDAIDYYLSLGRTIEQRLRAINDASSRQKFYINKNIDI